MKNFHFLFCVGIFWVGSPIFASQLEDSLLSFEFQKIHEMKLQAEKKPKAPFLIQEDPTIFMILLGEAVKKGKETQEDMNHLVETIVRTNLDLALQEELITRMEFDFLEKNLNSENFNKKNQALGFCLEIGNWFYQMDLWKRQKNEALRMKIVTLKETQLFDSGIWRERLDHYRNFQIAMMNLECIRKYSFLSDEAVSKALSREPEFSKRWKKLESMAYASWAFQELLRKKKLTPSEEKQGFQFLHEGKETQLIQIYERLEGK